MRFSVSRALSHIAPVTVSHGVTGRPPSPRPVPCRLSRATPRRLPTAAVSLRRLQQFGGALVVGKPAAEIAVHDREGRAGFLEHREVVIGPVPEADLEAHFGEALARAIPSAGRARASRRRPQA